jgi:hypothetical protein
MPPQSAWAFIGHTAAGAEDHRALARGSDCLLQNQEMDGLWLQCRAAVDVGCIFQFRCRPDGKLFPLRAPARYRNLRAGNGAPVEFGM